MNSVGSVVASLREAVWCLRADIVGDGLCVIFGSVLRGCGLQVMAAKVVVFSYCAPQPSRALALSMPRVPLVVLVPVLMLA